MFYSAGLTAQNDIEKDWIFKNSKSLSELWELDDTHHRGTFIITSYKPIYLSLAKFTTNTNKSPVSVNSDNFVNESIDSDPIEAKFQLSLKTKVFHDMLWGKADLWIAFFATLLLANLQSKAFQAVSGNQLRT